MSLSIYSYTNYRLYLHDHFQSKKQVRRGWSIRAWARQLGLSSPSTLTMILKGDRNPGDELTAAICRQFGLKGREESYFRDLVELQRVEGNPRDSVLVMERLAQQRPSGEFQELSRESFLAISRWHYYAIREMVRFASFREDPEWIASRLEFRVGAREVKDAIRVLLKLQLLRRDEAGKLHQAGGHVLTESDVADEAIKRFHEQALENARESIRRHDPAIREFFGTTLSTPRKKLPQAKALIRKFHEDFSKLMEEGESDSVYQLEIGFFPVAIEEKGK